MLWRMYAEPQLDRIGIMLARLDNLPPRHCSVTLHAAAPEVDFRTSLRAERISGRHDPCSRNSPCHARHGKPPAMACRLRKLRELQDPGGGRPALGCEIGKSLAEIAGITGSWRRPSRAGLRDWQIACGNCGNYKILAAVVPRRAARLAYRLRKLRELQDPGGGRPALGLEIGKSRGNAEMPWRPERDDSGCGNPFCGAALG